MCCENQCPKPEKWGFSCRHCGAWLDIGHTPTEEEIKLNCVPCAECECAAKKSSGRNNDLQRTIRRGQVAFRDLRH